MSGGLDSSVAAILLQQQGYEVVGISLKFWIDNNDDTETFDDAKLLAEQLKIPYYVFDYPEKFKNIVVQNFLDEYMCGRTPNPCVLCNIQLKWASLIEKAQELNCNYIATGHYANINQHDNRYFISKSKDAEKDQSYVLWGLPQEYLAKTIFQLGNYTKKEVREIALKIGFDKIANKRESYDVCFIPDNNYRDFLFRHIPDLNQRCPAGNFIDKSGKIVGTHKGYPFYTIGQRKGLVIAFGTPKYVFNINAQTNEIFLGDKEDLLSNNLIIKKYNLMKYTKIPSNFTGEIKIRYRSKGQTATIEQYDDYIKVQFQEPVSAITPGQSAVIYENNDVVGGGVIGG
jgi:tRNA-specific 2-thiouridylase